MQFLLIRFTISFNGKVFVVVAFSVYLLGIANAYASMGQTDGKLCHDSAATTIKKIKKKSIEVKYTVRNFLLNNTVQKQKKYQKQQIQRRREKEAAKKKNEKKKT